MIRRGIGILALLFFAPLVARGGDWHVAEKGKCTDCHTQHNSQDGAPMRTDNNPDPAGYMLLRENVNALCLSCHDGGRPEAPDVLAPVSYVADPAAGFFTEPAPTPSTGHDLTLANVIPPGGTQPMTLTCVSCHDPHGNANYRNLREDPGKSGQPALPIAVRQTVIANGTNPAQVYTPSNIVDRTGISTWCGSCHGGQSTNDHPVDRTIWGSVFASYTTWSAPKAYRVRSGNPSDVIIPSQDDQVICLSCHQAHGGVNPRAVIYADGVTSDSTCQECHNQ